MSLVSIFLQILNVTSRGTLSLHSLRGTRRASRGAHRTRCGVRRAASEAARSAEALEQESVPREVTSMCPPTQSIMACEYRGRTDVTSAQNVVARCGTRVAPERRRALPVAPIDPHTLTRVRCQACRRRPHTIGATSSGRAPGGRSVEYNAPDDFWCSGSVGVGPAREQELAPSR